VRHRRSIPSLVVAVAAALCLSGIRTGDAIDDAPDASARTYIRLASPTLLSTPVIRAKAGCAPGVSRGWPAHLDWLAPDARGERFAPPPAPRIPTPRRLPLASRPPPRA
jgi:hypothetical protein